MKTNLEVDITTDVLMNGIAFHKETYLDTDACKKIDDLTHLFREVLFELNKVKAHTLQEPNNSSGTDIREKIDKLMEVVQIESQDFEEDEQKHVMSFAIKKHQKRKIISNRYARHSIKRQSVFLVYVIFAISVQNKRILALIDRIMINNTHYKRYALNVLI